MEMLEGILITKSVSVKENISGDILSDETPKDIDTTMLLIIPKYAVVGHLKKQGIFPLLNGNYAIVEQREGTVLNFVKAADSGLYIQVEDCPIYKKTFEELKKLTDDSTINNETFSLIRPKLFEPYMMKKLIKS